MSVNLHTRPRNGKWQYIVSYKSHGKWRQISKQGFDSEYKAKVAGKARMMELDLENIPEPSGITLKEVVDLLIKDGERAEATKVCYTGAMTSLSELSALPVQDITYVDISKAINEYAQTHKQSSTKTMVRVVKLAMKYAHKKLRLISKNPAEDFVLRLPKESDTRVTPVLTIDEMNLLIDSLSGEYQFITAIMALGGLRIGEARGVTYSSFDLKNNVLRVTGQGRLGKGRELAPLKSKNSYREVPLIPKLKQMFLALPTPIDKEARIFTRYLDSSGLTEKYRQAGFDGVTPHALRHSYATYCIQLGMDFKTVASIIGDSVQMVYEVYSHVNRDMRDRAQELLAKI